MALHAARNVGDAFTVTRAFLTPIDARRWIKLALSALIQVPIVAYLRYYALLVLGDVEAEFDLVPDRRDGLDRQAGTVN